MRYLVLAAVLAMCATPATADDWDNYFDNLRRSNQTDYFDSLTRQQERNDRQYEIDQQYGQQQRILQELEQLRRLESERQWQRELRSPRYQTR